eukprot:7222674-Pyramimonas_sp.AAC.1
MGQPPGGPYPHTLGIVGIEEEERVSVKMVRWTDPEKLVGRKLKIDHNSRVIWPTACLPAYAPVSFQGSIMIHPATGITMRKEKGKDRTEIPDNIKRLMAMWEAAFMNNAMLDQPELAQLQQFQCQDCAWSSLCTVNVAPSDDELLGGEPTFTCA